MARRRIPTRSNAHPTATSWKHRFGFRGGFTLVVKYTAKVQTYTVHGWNKHGFAKNYTENDGSMSTLKVTLTKNGSTIRSRSFKGTRADAWAATLSPFRTMSTARLWPTVKPSGPVWTAERGEHTKATKHHDRSEQGDHGCTNDHTWWAGPVATKFDTPAVDDVSDRAEAWRRRHGVPSRRTD